MLRKGWKIISSWQFILLLIIMGGFFLRAYHHKDWLNFQLDQARDSYKVTNFLDKGWSKLPLLGPTARGTGLFLGPVFYYFQIISAFIFGDYPNIHAWPDLFFSVLAIPLAFLFFRYYFNIKLSLALTALVSFSTFLVRYGRFGWNPNALIFFMPLGAFCLLKSVQSTEKIRGAWFVGAVAAFTISSQLHFIAFFTAPLVLFLFLIHKRRFPSLKTILTSLAVILFLYSPVIYSEVKTNWKNSRVFLDAVQEKKGKHKEKTIFEKAFRASQETARTYWVIWTANQSGDFIKTKREKLTGELKFDCNNDCEKSFVFIFFTGVIVFIGGVGLLKNIFNRSLVNEAKKDFAVLNIFWIASSFIVLIPIGYQISPRFFLASALPAFVFLGVFLENFFRKISKGNQAAVFLAIGFLILANLKSNLDYFFLLEASDKKPVKLERDLILLKDEVVTLRGLEKVSDWIIKNSSYQGDIHFIANNRYARPIKYLLEKKYNQRSYYYKAYQFQYQPDKNYFIVSKTKSVYQVPDEVAKKFFVEKEQIFGSLKVYKLKERF